MALPKLYDRIIWHNDTEPALNEDNLNAMSKGLDDVDDRLIDLAGTIMEDVPQIIEDMEILEPAIENIDANVARAETAADNAEVEALKSEGYAAGTQDGVEVTSGEYYQNNAKYYAEIANPPIENTVDFTDIIAVTDAINKAAKDVKLKVTPKQDLHGYANPWVGGAGKNKIPMTVEGIKAANTGGTWNGNVYTAGTLIFTLQTKDNNVVGISVNGSQTSSYFFILGNIALGLSRGLSTWDNPTVDGYTISSGTTGDSSSTYGVGWDNSNNNVYIVMRANASVSNKVFYPQIEVGTSATAFEPYTNICPITGHSELKLTRAGKNVLLPFITSGLVRGVTWTLNADGTATSSGTASPSASQPQSARFTLPQGNYFLSGCPTGGSGTTYFLRILGYDSNNTAFILGTDTGAGAAFTVDNTVKGLLVFASINNGVTAPNGLWQPMIESGSDGTDYEPYQGEEITISLNGTKYDGVLDVSNGVLANIEHGFKVLNGSEGITWSLASNDQDVKQVIYANIASILPNTKTSGREQNSIIFNMFVEKATSAWSIGEAVIDSNNGAWLNMVFPPHTFADSAAFNAWLANNNVQFTYELATPQTIQLTPTQVYLLYGYNTLFGDCGDISLTYDASGIIHIEEAKLDTETLKTIAAASSDFADFKARIAAL